MTSSPTTPETSTEDETLAILVQRPKVKEVLEMEHLNQISESPFRQISQQSFTVSTPSWPISQVLASQRKSGSQARRIESMLNSKGVISSFAYVVASVSMVLANKMILSSYNWNAPISLMMFQNIVSATVLMFLRFIQVIPSEPVSLRLAKMWIPVNILFVGMLVTSLLSLQYLQVAIATVLKNCTNLLTACGESYLSNKRHDLKVWGSLFLMVFSAALSGHTDLSFNLIGYTWQTINCFLTASYVLTLRHVMKSVRQITPGGAPLGEFTMVLLNSLLSIPFSLGMIFVMGENRYVLASPLLKSPSFWGAITFSGFLGLLISFSSMWCLHLTSPTTFSLIGSLNKIPLAIFGIFLFNAPVSLPNLASISVGLFAGFLFAFTKMIQSQEKQ